MGDNDGVVGVAHLSATLKTIIGLLTILTIVVPPTAAFLLFHTRIESNEKTITRYGETESSHWKRTELIVREVSEAIEENEDSIHAIKLQNAVIETRFQQILKEVQTLNSNVKSLGYKIDKWEPVRED